MVAFVNHFIVNTVTFLNKFIANCETKFIAFESKLQKVEASLLIVEAKVFLFLFFSSPQIFSFSCVFVFVLIFFLVFTHRIARIQLLIIYLIV